MQTPKPQNPKTPCENLYVNSQVQIKNLTKVIDIDIASFDGQIVVVVQMNSGNVHVLVNVKVDEFFSLIWNVIFFEGLIHVKRSAEAFPSVACGMLVEVNVTVQNLVESFLTAHFNNVIVFSLHVDDS